jgi:[citrate (pro-3S)-lyase] ligase
MDVMIFGAIIAPMLNITHRFVGEEPFCVVTNSYNRTLSFLLPDMGIKVHKIARSTYQEMPISASTVRKAIMEGDIELVRAMVPPHVFHYLVETCGMQVDPLSSVG